MRQLDAGGGLYLPEDQVVQRADADAAAGQRPVCRPAGQRDQLVDAAHGQVLARHEDHHGIGHGVHEPEVLGLQLDGGVGQRRQDHLVRRAKERPRLRLEIARGGTDLLVQALRERTLDALVIDARWLRPAPDLDVQHLHDMRGCFMVRRGHPVLARRARRKFDELLRYPIASTPLSDETARALVALCGPGANPGQFVTLRCEQVASLVDVARHSDTALLAIRAAAADLVVVALQPALEVMARFGLVTLRRRTAPPGLPLVRELMTRLLVDRME